jgi:cation transport ATPase
VALFRRTSDSGPPEPQPTAVETEATRAAREAAKKARPTPTRKEAEAARRQRVHRTLSKKEARAESSRQNREQRMRSLNAREATPEKALLRDYVDTRFNIGEFLLPSLVLILAVSFLGQVLPRITVISTVLMYLFIVAVLVDGYLIWRGFKKVLAARMPNAPTRGLLMYAINRSIQIRRFRLPRPRLKRGDKF